MLLPSSQSTRKYLLGLIPWTLGTGSFLHPILLEARDGHSCIYGQTSWLAAMGIAAVLGLIAFPMLAAFSRALGVLASDISYAGMALRLGSAHLALTVMGLVLAVLVSIELIEGSDLGSHPFYLVPLLLTPVFFVVLGLRPAPPSGFIRSLIKILPQVFVVSLLPVLVLLWRFHLPDDQLLPE